MATDPWLYDGIGREVEVCVFEVYRYRPENELEPMERLPSVEVLTVQEELGVRPQIATLRYRFGDGNTLSPPNWEEAFGDLNVLAYPHALIQGRRIAIKAVQIIPSHVTGFTPIQEWIFDGTVYARSGMLSNKIEDVHIIAVGIGQRQFDTVKGGQYFISPSAPAVPEKATDIPAIFNEKGDPNCCPADQEIENRPLYKHPLFSDPLFSNEDFPARRFWNLPRAVAYAIYESTNAQDPTIRPIVQTRSEIDALLRAKVKSAGIAEEDFDPTDDSTFDFKEIPIPATPITGRTWPQIVYSLVSDKGFACQWFTGGSAADVNSTPTNTFTILELQVDQPKSVSLQARSAALLDIEVSNVSRMDATRDFIDAPNEWLVLGDLSRYEGSFVLAPGFPSEPTDADGPEAFAKGPESDFFSVRNKYRLFVFDECGEGHYNYESTTKIFSGGSLDNLFGTFQGIRRRRPALQKLITTGDDGAPLEPVLLWSTNYAGPYPGLWDGTGTWQAAKGFEVLDDRLGIWINIENPQRWEVGNTADGEELVLDLVTGSSFPLAAAPRIYLMLVAAIEADSRVKGVASRRSNAALPETITRAIDASDRYRKDTIRLGSWYNQTLADDVVRDDTELANDEAYMMRNATDAGVLDGTITIPWFTRRYRTGDRISEVFGRSLDLRTNGDPHAKAPVFPVVSKIRYDLTSQPPKTILELSDANMRRVSYRQRQSGMARIPGAFRF